MVPVDMLGVWSVNYASGSKSTYNITRQDAVSKVHVVSCSWSHCKSVSNGALKPSQHDVYNHTQGWLTVDSLHK